jgi:hypothetical protein
MPDGHRDQADLTRNKRKDYALFISPVLFTKTISYHTQSQGFDPGAPA